MKGRLFFTILCAFWLTFFAMSQGVWLMFQAREMGSPSSERLGGPPELKAAADVFRAAGEEGFDVYRANLPEPMRINLVLLDQPASGTGGRPPRRMEVEAVGPDGERKWISWSNQSRPAPWRVFNIPLDFLIMGILGGLLFSAALAFYLVLPINRLREAFEQLSAGKLETRVSPAMAGRNDEIADLGRDFDRMAVRLEELVAARIQLLHDVSHELRSPLARMHLAIALMRQSDANTESSIDRMTLEIQRIDELVDELLTLSRLEYDGGPTEGDYFDLPTIIHSVINDAQYEAASAGLDILLIENAPSDEEDRAPLQGDARLIRRAFDNILRNAIRFSPKGETVLVRVTLEESARRYRVEIEDRGSGADGDQLQSIFDPFVRSHDQGVSHGLGLSIARRAVEVHHGAISACNVSPRGFCVRLDLPA